MTRRKPSKPQKPATAAPKAPSDADVSRIEVTAKKFAIAQSIATILAILTGGVWAFFNFSLFRTTADNLSVKIVPTVTRYNNDNYLLTITLNVSNLGKTRVYAGAKGCELMLRKLDRTKVSGQALAYDYSNNKSMKWSESGTELLPNLDMLRHYDPGTYWLEPGVEYHEIESIVIPKDGLIVVKTTFWVGDADVDAITEYKLCDIPSLYRDLNPEPPSTANKP